MQLKRLLNALEKNQIKVEKKDPWGTGNMRWIASKKDRTLEFFENGKGSEYVTHLTARHPDTDAMVDLFMDSYFHTIKGSIKYLNG